MMHRIPPDTPPANDNSPPVNYYSPPAIDHTPPGNDYKVYASWLRGGLPKHSIFEQPGCKVGL